MHDLGGRPSRSERGRERPRLFQDRTPTNQEEAPLGRYENFPENSLFRITLTLTNPNNPNGGVPRTLGQRVAKSSPGKVFVARPQIGAPGANSDENAVCASHEHARTAAHHPHCKVRSCVDPGIKYSTYEVGGP